MENAKEAMATEKCAMVINELGFRGQIEADFPEFRRQKKWVHLLCRGEIIQRLV